MIETLIRGSVGVVGGGWLGRGTYEPNIYPTAARPPRKVRTEDAEPRTQPNDEHGCFQKHARHECDTSEGAQGPKFAVHSAWTVGTRRAEGLAIAEACRGQWLRRRGSQVVNALEFGAAPFGGDLNPSAFAEASSTTCKWRGYTGHGKHGSEESTAARYGKAGKVSMGLLGAM